MCGTQNITEIEIAVLSIMTSRRISRGKNIVNYFLCLLKKVEERYFSTSSARLLRESELKKILTVEAFGSE